MKVTPAMMDVFRLGAGWPDIPMGDDVRSGIQAVFDLIEREGKIKTPAEDLVLTSARQYYLHNDESVVFHNDLMEAVEGMGVYGDG
jgi:hypothetical protein